MSRLLNVKVNLSSLDLMRNDCSSHFIRMMDEYEIRHEWIQFEITETVATEYSASLGMVVDGQQQVFVCVWTILARDMPI